MNSFSFCSIQAALILAFFSFSDTALADMIVRTTDGRVIRVEVEKSEIRSIEFVEDSTTPPPPPSTRPPQAAPPSESKGVTGTWSVTFDGRTTTILTLRQSGNTVNGTLKTTDNSAGAVTGRISADNLELSRDSGLQTVRHYKVIVKGNRFSGTYRNEGRYPGRGSFEGVRR